MNQEQYQFNANLYSDIRSDSKKKKKKEEKEINNIIKNKQVGNKESHKPFIYYKMWQEIKSKLKPTIFSLLDFYKVQPIKQAPFKGMHATLRDWLWLV